MTLTLSHGPLSGHPPATVNYDLSGPAHRLLLDDFPRRVRAMFAGETVADTEQGKLLHETGILPQLYIPIGDVRADLLQPSRHNTSCPFKGTASYWSIQVGDRRAAHAVWAYPEPLERAGWLRGYQAIYWERVDAWLDEDELVEGHLRDPYHRVDVRDTGRHVRVLADGEMIGESRRAKVLSETGLPNRFYLPLEDVRTELLAPTDTSTVCPYKGTASYWSLAQGRDRVEDVAWSYPDPLEDALKVRGHLCFDHDSLDVEIDRD